MKKQIRTSLNGIEVVFIGYADSWSLEIAYGGTYNWHSPLDVVLEKANEITLKLQAKKQTA